MAENDPNGIRQQLRRNTVALISLAVALTALTYNTWRNELTEHNRNQRAAGFEILTELAQLQLTADFLHYGEEAIEESPIRGWARVLLIRDLSRIMSADVQRSADALYATWQSHWEGLGQNDSSVEAVTEAIESTRKTVLAEVRSLE